MTIRDKVEEESPDGRVLFLEDLRESLGIGTSDRDAPAAEEASDSVNSANTLSSVLLIGHDLRGDFPKMRAEGINFDPYLAYCGCIDTYVVVKDTGNEQFGESLGCLMAHYGLASGRIVRPKKLPASKAKFVFFGGQNAGNDAIGILKVAIAQALDPEIRSRFRGKSGSEDGLTDDFLSKPLGAIEKNTILLAYDSHGVESNRYDRQRRPIGPATTEHGFAWLNLAAVADIPPGPNGTNWHSYIQARNWLNWDYRNFANFKYVVGNPRGFWKEFGETQYYFKSEGPTPFHRMFQEISCPATLVKERSDTLEKGLVKGSTTVEEVTTLLEKTPLGEKSSASEDKTVDSRGSTSLLRGNWRGRETFRGNSKRGHGKTASQRGGTQHQGGNSGPNHGKMAGNRGRDPTYRGTSARANYVIAGNRGKGPDVRGSSAEGSEKMVNNTEGNSEYKDDSAWGVGKMANDRGRDPTYGGSSADDGWKIVGDKGKGSGFRSNFVRGNK